MVAKAPKAPDPVATAQAQSQMNRETAITQYNLNATDQRTPYGDLTYKQVGKWEDGTPRYEATQTLSPELAAISKNLLGSADSLSGNLSNTVGKAFDPSNLPARGAAMTGGVGMETSLQQKGVSLPQVPVEASWSGPQARYNIDNAGPIQKSIGADDWSADRNRVEEAVFSRLNPSLERDRASLDAKLRAQGITQGSEAYRNAADELNRSATDARLQTILAGGQEQSRLAGLELQQGNFRNSAQAQQYGQNANDAAFFNSAQNQNFGQSMAMDQFAREGRMENNDIMLQDVGFNNNAALQQASFRNQAQNQGFNQQLAAEQYNNGNRQQALQEAAYFRSLPLNDINALLSGTQIAGPQFTNTPTPGVAGVDYTGLVSQNYQAQVQAANQKNANLFGGLASIGSGIFGAAGAAKGFGNLFSSDRRLKRDIHPMPAKLGGFQLYSYRYLGCDALSFGVMADEVEAVMPEAVTDLNGFKAVYYDMLEAA